MNGHMNGHSTTSSHAISSSSSTLSLLQRFTILQATRTSLSHELSSAFDEAEITDAALDRVIQISSIGLLEVKSEIEEILEILQESSRNNEEVREEVFCIKEVERLEVERVKESVKGLQIKRMARVQNETMNEDARRDVERAVQESTRRTGQLVQDINEALMEIRASISDRDAAGEDEAIQQQTAGSTLPNGH